MSDQDRGFYHKFIVRRVDETDGPGRKHEGCEYFVLDLTHDKHAPAALRTYAESCQDEYPMLAADLREKVGGWRPPAMQDREDGLEVLAFHRGKWRHVRWNDEHKGWHLHWGGPFLSIQHDEEIHFAPLPPKPEDAEGFYDWKS
jgi:hypothetical protein